MEGADEVERARSREYGVRSRKGGEFGGELLDAVFAEEALASSVGFENGLGGVGFADGHEGDGGGVAVGAGAGVVELVAEAFEIGGDGVGGEGHLCQFSALRGRIEPRPG